MGVKQSIQRRRLDTVPSLSPAPAPSPSPPHVPNVQFRVLIIGRANAGKTSILQRVCDTTESPVIYSFGPEGTRRRVRAQRSLLIALSIPSSIQVELDPTIEVRWPYFCRKQLIITILLTAWASRHQG